VLELLQIVEVLKSNPQSRLGHHSETRWDQGTGLTAMLTWLETQSRWSKLRSIGQSNMVRASVLMPAFGYLLLLNDEVQRLLVKIKFDHGWLLGWLLQHLPSTWRIWLLFYGTFSLAVGSILFSWLCPPEIKRYSTAFQMVDAERQHWTSSFLDQLPQEVKAVYHSMSKWENEIFPLPRLEPDLDNMGFGGPTGIQSSDQWGLALIHIWTIKDIKHPKLRILIWSLFVAGIGAVAIPAAITFINVTEVAGKRMFAYLVG